VYCCEPISIPSQSSIQHTAKSRTRQIDGNTRGKMAGRLSNVASRIMGGNGVVMRSAAASLRGRAGMGLPVGRHIVPNKPLAVNDELVWDNGTNLPEPCIDRIADTVGKYEALAWLCGGLSFFASLGLLAVWNDKASKIPFVSRDMLGSKHFSYAWFYTFLLSNWYHHEF
ncbi:unnamed protein product, partial [Linum tenue]